MENKAIIVIGMHRSGTSAISGLLSELGVFMGKSLYGPQQGVNEKGFYENARLVELNEQLFDQLAISWDDPTADCLNDFPTANLPIEQAVRLLETEYSQAQVWGMKDPRTSLLLPYWHKAFKQLAISPYFILMMRHPYEVAGSLAKRDQFSLDKGAMLWLNYTFSSYLSCKDQKLMVISYDKLLSEPQDYVGKIAQFAQLTLSDTSTSFIDRSLKHQSPQPDQSTSALMQLACDTYDALTAANVDHQQVLTLYEEYQLTKVNCSAVLAEHLKTVKKQEIEKRKLFLEAYQSIWWKISWPLKQIEQWLRK